MRAMRARLESRAGGRVGQPWRDLRKQPVIPADAGAFFTAAPVVLMATSVLVAAAAPYLSTRGPLSGVADVVVVGLLLLGAVALADLATTVMASLEHDARGRTATATATCV